MRAIVVCALALVASACGRGSSGSTAAPPTPSPSRDEISSTEALLAAMRDRYAGKWYRNITFTQKTTFLRPDGTPSLVQTWYEAGAIPGRLRIDIGEPAKGNGALYRRDSVYSLQEGKVVRRQAGRNPLLILGFDVYAQAPARTLSQLRAEGIDVSRFRSTTFNGKRMYVVGAVRGDSTSNQFWVEAERLLFVRLIQTNAERTRTSDTRFEKYVKHGGGWVAEEVRVLVGGRMVFHEEYSNVKVNVTLDDNLFVPEKWATAKHWYAR